MTALQSCAELPEAAEGSMRIPPVEFPTFPIPENPQDSLENPGFGAWNAEEAEAVLRLPRESPGETRPKQKPVGKAFAMVAKRSNGNSLASEFVKSKDGDEEIIKVYLKARGEHEEPVSQLKSEVRHIQEAGSALKKLREDLSSKLQTRTEFREFREFREFQENSEVMLEKRNWSCSCRGNSCQEPEEEEKSRNLLRRLQEAEKKHQLERENFQQTLQRYSEEVNRANCELRSCEMERDRRESELGRARRSLGSMEKDHRALLSQLQSAQSELQRLRDMEKEQQSQRERCSQLQQEISTLREKIHHLDDMLKSQQRKVRHMIEQLQNSKAVIQAKDVTIQELKERVSYLEAENLEMHDRIEHLIQQQVCGASGGRGRSKSESAGSKRLPGPKPLPLIRVLET